MQNFAVNLLINMLEFYSPSGYESDLAKFLFKRMSLLGLKTHIDKVGNVIGEFGHGSPSILLCGHMDTVSGKLPVVFKENILYGRGAVDAKTSLAAMIVAASILKNENFPGKVIVACVVDEEGEGTGIKQLIEAGVSADYAIFGEPSGVDNITIAYKGSLHLKVLVRTATGHSSAPWLFDNAVEKAFDLAKLLSKINFLSEKKESRFYSITSSLTKIIGGSSFSQVPSKCIFHIDFRVPPQIAPSALYGEIKHVISEYAKKNSAITLQFKVLGVCEPYETDTNSLLIRSLSWAIRMVRGKPAIWVRKTGTSDLNLYGISVKVPIVAYGAGDSHLDHTSEERVDLKDYEDTILVLCKGINRLMELHKRRKEKELK